MSLPPFFTFIHMRADRPAAVQDTEQRSKEDSAAFDLNVVSFIAPKMSYFYMTPES